jgi:hypothetical protein
MVRLHRDEESGNAYLEVTAVEGTVGVNDHESEAPLLHVHILDLEHISGLDGNELWSKKYTSTYITEMHPFLLLQGLQFGHQPVFSAARAGSRHGCQIRRFAQCSGKVTGQR